MKEVRLFHSFEETKASEVEAATPDVVKRRQKAFAKFMALLRTKAVKNTVFVLTLGVSLLSLITCDTRKMERSEFSKEQIDRRMRSDEIARVNDVPVNLALPYTEDVSEVTVRSKDEVVDRALALCFIALKGEGLEQELLSDFGERFNIYSKLSPSEKIFADSRTPSDQQMISATWRYESLKVMLWYLGYVDELEYPDSICNVAELVSVFQRFEDEKAFRTNVTTRSKGEVLDQTDLSYRLDWACVDARINGKPVPGRLEKGVVYERHYSLNWLTGYMDQGWDEVTTDT